MTGVDRTVTIEIDEFLRRIRPAECVLLFGSGSSIPSNAPSVADLQGRFETEFGVPALGYSLAEQSSIIEVNIKERALLISALRTAFKGVTPAGGILNLPLYEWRSIFTTNYDNIIEAVYKRRARPLRLYHSDFDFALRGDPAATKLFKLHGTIDHDVSDGHNSRIILTQSDYDKTHDYREKLYQRLDSDIADAHLVIIGHSLADRHIADLVDRAIANNQKVGQGGRISLFMYTPDEGRAALYEARGLEVCFGGLDDFFAGMAERVSAPPPPTQSEDPLDHVPALRPVTVDVSHAVARKANVGQMFNGSPATYGDVAAGNTFAREITTKIVDQFDKPEKPFAILLGASGVGKTTAARQVLHQLSQKGYSTWEHKIDLPLNHRRWRDVAKLLADKGRKGVLFVDEAHAELQEVNDLADALDAERFGSLKILLVSPKHQWQPRVKAPALYRAAAEHHLSRVTNKEIDRLLDLLESNREVRNLVESAFVGFNRAERRRRLTERCEADMFVCLRHIFSSESFDDILLREYAALDQVPRDIYREVTAMESAGVRVHRQLVMRLLNIPATSIPDVLGRLTDIITEETVDEREGIFAWRGRHKVISDIIASHKYHGSQERRRLFNNIIEALNPTYDIEIRTMKELCNVDSGIASLPNKDDQNELLRKMISIAPAERVPRHRLMKNLIVQQAYELADTEIRLFQKEFGLDGPATRYKIDLQVERAVNSPGLMEEDRVVLLDRARQYAVSAVSRFRFNKAVIISYCELGLAQERLTGDASVFEAAIAELKAAETRIGDPDISKAVARLERVFSRQRSRRTAHAVVEMGNM